MTDERDQVIIRQVESPALPERRRGDYHVPLYIFGAILAVIGLVLLVYGIVKPGVAGVLALGVVFVVMSVVTVAATAAYRRDTEILEAVHEQNIDMATIAYDVGRTNDYARESVALHYRVIAVLDELPANDAVREEIAALRAYAEKVRADLDSKVGRARSEGYLEGVRERLGGRSHVARLPPRVS